MTGHADKIRAAFAGHETLYTADVAVALDALEAERDAAAFLKDAAEAKIRRLEAEVQHLRDALERTDVGPSVMQMRFWPPTLGF